ncbi:MAG: CHASE2 domain-containing protein [Fulvivirga sp.]
MELIKSVPVQVVITRIFILIIPAIISCSSTRPRCLEYFDQIVLVNSGSLNRTQIAQLIDQVSIYEPKVIGFNGVFATEKSGDGVLINTLNNIDNLVLAASTAGENIEKSYFDKNRFGSTDFLLDWKDEVSTYQLFFESNDSLVMSFPLKVLQAYDSSYATLKRNMNEYDIIYNGNCMCFPIVDHKAVMSNNVNDQLLNNKIVLLGYLGDDYNPGFCVEGERNVFPTPLNAVEYKYENDRNNMHGTLILANIIYSIIKQNE